MSGPPNDEPSGPLAIPLGELPLHEEATRKSMVSSLPPEPTRVAPRPGSVPDELRSHDPTVIVAGAIVLDSSPSTPPPGDVLDTQIELEAPALFRGEALDSNPPEKRPGDSFRPQERAVDSAGPENHLRDSPSPLERTAETQLLRVGDSFVPDSRPSEPVAGPPTDISELVFDGAALAKDPVSGLRRLDPDDEVAPEQGVVRSLDLSDRNDSDAQDIPISGETGESLEELDVDDILEARAVPLPGPPGVPTDLVPPPRVSAVPERGRVTVPPLPREVGAPFPTSDPPVRMKPKKGKAWYEDFFSEDFLRTARTPRYSHIQRQCDFVESSLGLTRGAKILEVGCGVGLHAVELAARGHEVVGVDLSLSMLNRATVEADERGQTVSFIHGDMRELTFDAQFDAAVCVGTSFGYFDDEGNRQALARIHRALKPRGLFYLEMVNRDYAMRSQPNLAWYDGNGCICMEETQFNFLTSRLHAKRTAMLEDGRQSDSEFSIRLYSVHEIGQLLHKVGFRVAEVSGHEATPGVFFGANSERMIVIAEKRQPRISSTPRSVTKEIPLSDPE